MGFRGAALTFCDAPVQRGHYRLAAHYPGADQLTEWLSGRTHTLAEMSGLPNSDSQPDWAATLGQSCVMGDNRAKAGGPHLWSADSSPCRERPKSRVFGVGERFQAVLHHPFRADPVGGTHSMINNVYLGRSQ